MGTLDSTVLPAVIAGFESLVDVVARNRGVAEISDDRTQPTESPQTNSDSLNSLRETSPDPDSENNPLIAIAISSSFSPTENSPLAEPESVDPAPLVLSMETQPAESPRTRVSFLNSLPEASSDPDSENNPLIAIATISSVSLTENSSIAEPESVDPAPLALSMETQPVESPQTRVNFLNSLLEASPDPNSENNPLIAIATDSFVSPTESSPLTAQDPESPVSPPPEPEDSSVVTSTVTSPPPIPTPAEPEAENQNSVKTNTSSEQSSSIVNPSEKLGSDAIIGDIGGRIGFPINGCWPPIPPIGDCWWRPIPEIIAPPSQSNLLVTDFTTPTTAQVGQAIALSWTVQNQGQEPTNTSYWSDAVYFSLDNILGNEDDIYITSVYRDQSTVLDPNGSYTLTQDIYLPSYLAGNGYLLVKTDAWNNQLETDETDNTQAIAFEITAPQDNLVVTDFTAPTMAQAGETISLAWTVQNQGPEATTTYWYDAVYFSLDSILGNEDDIYITSVYRDQSTALDPNGSYTVTQDVYLPSYITGNGYLLVKTDAWNYQLETDEADNTQAIAFEITAPQDNLVVTDFTVPATAQAGETISLSWTVQNQGPEATTTGYWDEVYFSFDDVLGNGDDFYLTSVYRDQSSVLDPNSSYTVTQDVYLPSYVAGNGYLLVKTDAYGNQLETDETDNTQAIAFNITAPQDNLVVTDFTAPTTTQAGQTISLSWTVTNLGSEATTIGDWSDRIYFSTDETLGQKDKFYYLCDTYPSITVGGCMPYPGDWGTGSIDDSTLADVYVPDYAKLPLGANESYTITLKVVLPDFVGEGYLFVETDAYDGQLETDESDNVTSVAITLQDKLITPIIDPEPPLPSDGLILVDLPVTTDPSTPEGGIVDPIVLTDPLSGSGMVDPPVTPDPLLEGEIDTPPITNDPLSEGGLVNPPVTVDPLLEGGLASDRSNDLTLVSDEPMMICCCISMLTSTEVSVSTLDTINYDLVSTHFLTPDINLASVI